VYGVHVHCVGDYLCICVLCVVEFVRLTKNSKFKIVSLAFYFLPFEFIIHTVSLLYREYQKKGELFKVQRYLTKKSLP
jgi:hypothetical protein